MSKSSFSSKLKITLLKGMEAIGTSASNLATNAKIKVNEINLETRRREILTNFSLQAFELWQKGVQLPDPLSEMLGELSEIEDRLSVLRAQKYAKVANGDAAAKADASTAEETAAGETVAEDATTTEEAAKPTSDASSAPAESAEQPGASVQAPRMSCSDGSDGGPIVCSLNHSPANGETPVAPILDLDAVVASEESNPEDTQTPRMSCSDGSDGGPIVCSLNHGPANGEAPSAPILDLDAVIAPDEDIPDETNGCDS